MLVLCPHHLRHAHRPSPPRHLPRRPSELRRLCYVDLRNFLPPSTLNGTRRTQQRRLPLPHGRHGLALHQEARAEQAAALYQVRSPASLSPCFSDVRSQGALPSRRASRSIMRASGTDKSSTRAQGQASLALVVLPSPAAAATTVRQRRGAEEALGTRTVVDPRVGERDALLGCPCLNSLKRFRSLYHHLLPYLLSHPSALS